MMLRVRKRNGELEDVQFEKVTNRIKFLCYGVLQDDTVIGEKLDICHSAVAQKVINKITDGITSTELDEFAAKFCASLAKEDYQYCVLGGRISASNHQKNTFASFSTTMQLLYENKKPSGESYPLLDKRVYKFISRNSQFLDAAIDHTRDYRFDFFGFKTLQGGAGKPGYLLRRHDLNGARNSKQAIETPQHLFMREAVMLHVNDYRPINEVLASIKETYDELSLGFYTHASPTMFNGGTVYQQLSSCYLLGIADSMDDQGGIPDCWKACARISKRAGGIGIGCNPIRSRGTLIAGTGGKSDGIVPLARVFNNIASYVNQGGRRPGAIALYVEPWCGDIYSFLDLRKNTGIEEERARDLFYALWIPDLFMKRLIRAVKNKGEKVMWSLMCPHLCPGLYTTYGDEFEELYQRYEAEGRYIKQVDIMHLWNAILTAQKETGTPYMLYKDHVNHRNAQANLGVIRNSNLCAEIVEYSDESEYAVCNLASVALPSFVVDGEFDYQRLYRTCKIAYVNLNRVIDINEYPVEECRRSNLRHRPVGLGVQGLGDVFALMGLPFEDTVDEEKHLTRINPQAREVNRRIAEVMYYACIEASMETARDRNAVMKRLRDEWLAGHIKFADNGMDVVHTATDEIAELCSQYLPIERELDRESHWGSYSSFLGSPASKGTLQFHMWNVAPEKWCDFMDWDKLVDSVVTHGLRSSLVRADMPTASTAQILGNVESTEPYKYCIYTRRVAAGEFVVVNKHMHQELKSLGLWTEEIQAQIIRARGSIGGITEIPLYVRDKYKTAYEISKKTIQLLSADRGAYIDQTQSQNYFIAHPNNKLLTNIHIGAWKLGLKTGMYYLRREPPEHPVQFTADGGLTVNEKSKSGAIKECTSCSA